MKTKHIILSFGLCFCVMGFGCGVGQAVKDMAEVGNAVEEEFGHDVTVGMNWNNNERSWTISFTSFEIENFEHDELEKMAEEVHQFITDEFGKSENQDFMVIRFSPDDDIDEYTQEKAEFRFDR